MSKTHMESSSRTHAAQSLPNWWIREQVEAASTGSALRACWQGEGYPNAVINSTSRTRSACRKIGCY